MTEHLCCAYLIPDSPSQAPIVPAQAIFVIPTHAYRHPRAGGDPLSVSPHSFPPDIVSNAGSHFLFVLPPFCWIPTFVGMTVWYGFPISWE